MYKSGIHFTRTKQQKESQQLSWKRNDEALFAAGACHILAYTFKGMYPKYDCNIIYIKPKLPHTSGNHVYIKHGEYAFDFSGWTRESELLSVFTKDYTNKYEGWSFDKITVKESLKHFCENNNHREPDFFYGDVIGRSKRFISKNVGEFPL